MKRKSKMSFDFLCKRSVFLVVICWVSAGVVAFSGPSIQDDQAYEIVLDSKQIEKLADDLYASYDQQVISYVHGRSVAAQLKKEQLTWINLPFFSRLCMEFIKGDQKIRPLSDVTEEVRDGLKRNKGKFSQMNREDSLMLHQSIASLYSQFFVASLLFKKVIAADFYKGMEEEWKEIVVTKQDSLVNYYLSYKSEFNKKLGESFLQWNKLQEGVQSSASGLQYKVLRASVADSLNLPTATSSVEVHYHGVLLDGKVFDSSFLRGETISFGLNQVIPGWTEGVQLMKVGELYRFYIPYQLAYGARGNSGIPPYSCLVFDVELFGFE